MFPKQGYKQLLDFVYQDITKPIKFSKKVDYVIHTANSTSSASFVNNPVETIDSIVKGTKNVLDFARKSGVKSLVYLSSMEVYGEIPITREEPLSENDYGYIDILKPRSSYQEGKRAAEALCSAYANEYGLSVKIARLAQTIGAGVDSNDNRVFTQFAKSVVAGQDIVLKTKGETVRSYCYITDAITAILSLLENGKDGDCYNVANPDTTCSIKEMAEMLCHQYSRSNLVIKEENDSSYLSTLKYYLSISKIKSETNWAPLISLETAYDRLINSLLSGECEFRDDTKSSKFLHKIFFLRNRGRYKLLTIFGITWKFDRTSLNKKRSKRCKIKNNLIVFNNFGGNGYGCNPKYIAEEIIKRNLPYELVWLCKNEKDVRENALPSVIKTIGAKNAAAIKTLYSAKVVVSNVHCNPLFSAGWVKKDGQAYIQTWHGSLGIKKIDYSVKNNNSTFFTKTWNDLAQMDIESIDYLITNSDFEKNVFKEGFMWNADFMNVGHPRNDIFFKNNEELVDTKRKVCSKLGISMEKKIVLYAPSFRDDKKLNVYNLDYDSLTNNLKEKFGGDWVIVLRLHPHHANLEDKTLIYRGCDNLVDASLYPDIQELLVASDIGITDYSSWIFDFMLSKKPGFIYAEDIEKYNTDRGFYYPLESTPFPVSTNNSELCKNIENFEYEKYKASVETFLNEKGCIEDGHASERVVDLIQKIMAD